MRRLSSGGFSKYMTKADAIQEFKEFGYLVRGDAPANREAWNNYTNMLAREGRISWHQCNTWVNPY